MKAIENEAHGTQNELYLFKIMKDGLVDHAEKVRVKNLKAILDFELRKKNQIYIKDN